MLYGEKMDIYEQRDFEIWRNYTDTKILKTLYDSHVSYMKMTAKPPRSFEKWVELYFEKCVLK